MFQKVMFGPLDKPENAATLRDLNVHERVVFAPIIVVALGSGSGRSRSSSACEASVQQFVERYQSTRRARAPVDGREKPRPASPRAAGAAVAPAAAAGTLRRDPHEPPRTRDVRCP